MLFEQPLEGPRTAQRRLASLRVVMQQVQPASHPPGPHPNPKKPPCASSVQQGQPQSPWVLHKQHLMHQVLLVIPFGRVAHWSLCLVLSSLKIPSQIDKLVYLRKGSMLMSGE